MADDKNQPDDEESLDRTAALSLAELRRVSRPDPLGFVPAEIEESEFDDPADDLDEGGATQLDIGADARAARQAMDEGLPTEPPGPAPATADIGAALKGRSGSAAGDYEEPSIATMVGETAAWEDEHATVPPGAPDLAGAPDVAEAAGLGIPVMATVVAHRASVDSGVLELHVMDRVTSRSEIVDLLLIDIPEFRAAKAEALDRVVAPLIALAPEGALVGIVRSGDSLDRVHMAEGFVEIPAESVDSGIDTILSRIRATAARAHIGVLVLGDSRTVEDALRKHESRMGNQGAATPIQFARRAPRPPAKAWLKKLVRNDLSVFDPLVRHGLAAVPNGKPTCTVLSFNKAFLDDNLLALERAHTIESTTTIVDIACRHGVVIIADDTPALTGERARAVAPWWAKDLIGQPGVELVHRSHVDRRLWALQGALNSLRSSISQTPLRVQVITDVDWPRPDRGTTQVGAAGLDIEDRVLFVDDQSSIDAQCAWLKSVTDEMRTSFAQKKPAK